jgi:hypothetical protein
VVLAGLCLSASAEMRVWRDTRGQQVTGEFVRIQFGRVMLRTPDKQQAFIPMDELSAPDKNYVDQLILPEIDLTVRKKIAAKERNPNDMGDGDYIDVVTLTLTVQKKSRMPYGGTLRAEVYFVGQEVVTDLLVLFGKKTVDVEFTEKNDGVFTWSSSADIRQYEEYNGQSRGSKYTGYVVMVFDPQGNRMAMKSSLSRVDEDKLDALRTFYVGTFFDDECRKRSVPRPDYYDSRGEF